MQLDSVLNSCHYSKGKTTSFSLLLLPTSNDMGRRRMHAAFILYKTLGYPELRYVYINSILSFHIFICKIRLTKKLKNKLFNVKIILKLIPSELNRRHSPRFHTQHAIISNIANLINFKIVHPIFFLSFIGISFKFPPFSFLGISPLFCFN